jgi:serine protease inhibitor
MKRRSAPLLAILILATASCAGSSDAALAKANLPRATADPTAANDAAGAVNAFGLDLYRRVATGDRNVVVSPASIALALGMARAGATGSTATEMDAVLHGLATDEHVQWLNALDAALATRTGTFRDANGDPQPVTLRIANAPFAQRGMKLVDTYLDALASRYGAGLRLVDYRVDPEGARKTINGWVAEQTEQRIPELLVPGSITPDVRLALVNAIYLKAAWLTPFTPEATQPGPFTRLDGTTVDVPMMQTSESLSYTSGDGWQAVELPYVGDSLAMTVIVPDDLATFERGLSSDRLAEITARVEPRPVDLRLPRFATEGKVDLATTLAAMGMPSAFAPDVADFAGITTAERLYISAVIHQANIDVDEKGTTAAAATAVVMRATAVPGEPVRLAVDRPFLFAVRDVPTGTVLFLGRVTDPSVKD